MPTSDVRPGRLVVLSDDECWSLLRSRPVGRLAWSGDDGVTILAPYEQYQPSDHPGLRTGVAPAAMQLFDLQADAGEQKDVAAEHPEVVVRLKRLYDAANQAVPTAPAPKGKAATAK